MTGEETIAEVRKHGDTVLLSFSCGKDAICSWLALRSHFPRIVPFYLYLVPGLEFVEQSLRYYEDWFGQRIYRLPHPSVYRMLNALVFQPPERCRHIEAANLLQPSYDDINSLLIEDLGLSADTFMASGVRSADSPNRRASILTHGAINWKRKTFFPIWDWNKAKIRQCLKDSGIKLPVDYRLFGRSFDGLDYRFLKPIHDHLPDDYRRILDWFPLADAELQRRTYAAR